jgi:hypothetical protein
MDPERVKQVDAFIKANGVTARADWGARADKIPDKPESYDWDYDTVVIHHSGRSGETDPKKIQNLHMDKNGWDDVGYHFMISPDGNVYEGRRLYYKGSHTELANTKKVGILVMGNFEKEYWFFGGEPNPGQILLLILLGRALTKQFATLTTLGGHKDFKKSTECPGNQLYPRLDDIRKAVGLLAP